MSKEEYFIKQQQKGNEQARKMNLKKTKKILAISLPILLFAAAAVILLNNFPVSKNQTATLTGTPRIEVNPKEIDAGNVPINGGLVKKDFEIKNTGSGDLKIDDIWTSCHCTRAVLKVAGKESPEFGMDHAGFWSQTLASGETAQLEVIFDPAFHGPQGVGPAVREIYLSTNDPQNKKAAVTLTANVTP